MWTPRRILLLLVGLFGFGAAYAGYARILGSIDGLPTLPVKFLLRATGNELPPPDPVSPTDAKLIEAFGPDCPERNYSAYPTKIHMPEDGVVFAAGRPQWGSEASRFVTLAPFSVAVYAKPRPQGHGPGEVTEITTLHADKAVLEFDRPIGNEKEMISGKAKLVGVELRSDPTPFTTDKRNGRIHITNNQRSADPNKALVFKTSGPVFYRVPDADRPNPAAPDIWTSAAVQVENRENMPRPLRGASLPAVQVPGAGPAFGTNVVADMVLGAHTPPPTITAEGMKIYLKPAPPPKLGQHQVKKRGPAFAGVRQIELSENVLMNLWADGKAGFPGAGPPDTTAGKPEVDTPGSPADPPLAAAAVAGGLADAGTLARRLGDKALVQVRTLGPFRYDYETNAARFEVAPQANPNLPNHVEVTRLSALGARDYLVCQLLELELDRPLTQGGTDPPADKRTSDRDKSPAIKAVRATGSHVYVSAESEQLEAQGTALVYRTGLSDPKDPKRLYTQTVLQGAPLLTVRAKNKLEAGRPDIPGQLVLTTAEPKVGSKEPKETRATVRGPGRVDLYDPATNDTTMRAVWNESLDHTKERLGGKDLDLFVFTGGGKFEDPKGAFDLAADTLKLWLDGTATDKAKGGQPLPFRLQGVGHVRGKSEDAVIKDTDHLNVWFTDVPPAAPTVVAAAPTALPVQQGADAARSPGVAAPPPLLADPSQPAPQPAKANPVHLSAATVEVWVVRSPQPKGEKPKGPPVPGGGSVRYELDRARCEGRVAVHQGPADPAKSPRGLDVAAATLHLNRAAAGHAITAIGTDALAAEVHFENVSLSGPHVVIDQPNNLVRVTGRGWLRMPSGSDLGGQNLEKPADLTVVWQDRMRFSGERREAEFVGKVQAEQRTENPGKAAASPGSSETDPTWGRSFALGHRLEVTFDKPVYFNQLKPDRAKPAPQGKKEDSPRIETVVCSPAPEDGEAGRAAESTSVVFAEEVFSARTGKHVKAQRVQARVLEMRAAGGTTFATASGPGESRTLQLGGKDLAAPPAVAGTTPTRTAMKPGQEEMKLTVVKFAGRLRLKDQRGIFQQAVYEDAVRVFHVPTENLNETIVEHAAPPRSVVLRCTDTLTVSHYKAKDGTEGTRQMKAVGGAKVQDDTYIGDGHTITYDGSLIVLNGYLDGLATLRQRERTADRTNYKTGREIRYETRTGAVNLVESSGGVISGK